MKADELRDLSLDELKAEHVRLLKERFNLRIKRSMDQLPQTHLMKQTKRDIARVKTIMREKTNG
ncbi:MAG: 50S ribosomal protein L29 [Gammaproteobacteria bacterium]|nr:50S ribosomal protein L29 [Gammaproteobacteria bacterium]